MIRQLKWLSLPGLLLLMTGCNFAQGPVGGVSPTVEVIEQTAVPSVTLTASATVTQATVQVNAAPTLPPATPTQMPTPTDTPGPYEYTIQADDTLGYIVQLFGYRDFGVFDEIVRMNDNIPNADSLPGPGAVILIPRQTATPTPEDFTPAPDLSQSLGIGVAPTSPSTGLNVDAPIIEHMVTEGQTIVDIAVLYNTTLEVLAVLNPDISFAGCNFEIQSGGPNCGPILQVGQTVLVPAPTPTPTLSPTPSGSETPTPTPTHAPPVVISPPRDAIVPAGPFLLEWVSVGVLLPDEVYLVQVTDTKTGQIFNDITRDTALLLPDSLVPTDGETHVMQWTVTVAKPNADGVYGIVSGTPEIRAFSWQSR